MQLEGLQGFLTFRHASDVSRWSLNRKLGTSAWS